MTDLRIYNPQLVRGIVEGKDARIAELEGECRRFRFVASAAQAALNAYEQRFESTCGVGNYVGPIDEEMKALRAALEKERAS